METGDRDICDTPRDTVYSKLSRDTLPLEMFGAFGSVWCKMALGEVGVSLP